jgi:hypothetical protein
MEAYIGWSAVGAHAESEVNQNIHSRADRHAPLIVAGHREIMTIVE